MTSDDEEPTQPVAVLPLIFVGAVFAPLAWVALKVMGWV